MTVGTPPLTTPRLLLRPLEVSDADAATQHWFETLERPVLRAPKAVANIRSRRISERSGMRVIAKEERNYVSGRLPAEIWEITRDEWLARRGG